MKSYVQAQVVCISLYPDLSQIVSLFIIPLQYISSQIIAVTAIIYSAAASPFLGAVPYELASVIRWLF